MFEKRFTRFLLVVCAVLPFLGTATAKAQESHAREIGVVPKPVKMEMGTGSYRLSSATSIILEEDSAAAAAAGAYLAEVLRKGTGLPFPVREHTGGDILLTTAGADASLGKEGYRLDVTGAGVFIRARQAAGLFYGAQTLRQLLPPETFGSAASPTKTAAYSIPCVHIEDYPRFGWRGMHLDVSRHFFDAEFVKRFIDNLAMHKINVFHWHLSDDDGWRVEIRKYPKLTEVGAWRGPNEALPPSYESGNQRYGGFYTQDQIRDIVRYAVERHVLIVPEIDVPAHSRAAIVAYPELLCAGHPENFKSVQDVPANVLCPSQEKTYEFLEGVFGELADLFPGPYIHVGGDERPKGPWEQCERCQKRMKEEDLANGSILQDRFLKRLQGFLKTRGKTMAGWDEVEQESVLDKDYVVTAWHNVKVGIAAAEKGYPVVMIPSPFTYFDLKYSRDPAEPGLVWAGVVSVEKAYSLDPKPETLPSAVAGRILGVQGALWSETLVSPDRPDYMAYPRVCALAEIGWTPQAQRAWPEFWSRLAGQHFARLDAAAILYRIPLPSARQTGREITIIPPYEGAQVRYTVDGSEPGPGSTLYTRPFELPEKGALKMRAFRPNGRASRTVQGVERDGSRQ